MPKVYFLFGIHNHQPVGNDSFVFNDVFENCYQPFMNVLKEFPEIKCNIHISGPLYDWILANHYEYIETLKEMSKKGQIEIAGGAYYEPILPIISDCDKLAQIRLMNDFIKKELGKAPAGMWLSERVWEPQLASIINKASLKYTFLDDVHFRSAGICDKELTGYYTTENDAKSIAVFPINKTLRFKIPFSRVEESVGLIKSFSQKEDVLITLFDDGEKFGSWPMTYDWIYNKGWLRKFFTLLLKNHKTIETITASEAMKKFIPKNLIYIPTSAYQEMDEWTMKPQEFLYYKELKDRLKKYSDYKKLRNYLRTGFFRNFFVKYPRANYMHKKMLYLSKNIHKHASVKKDKIIFENLYKAQCNCGYWHGLFGGFYLGNIRGAIYENLIKAEKELDKKYNKNFPVVKKTDFDFDGLPEIIVKNKHLISSFSNRGGTLLELSYKDKNFNLLNTITRQEEAYHSKIKYNDKKKKKNKRIKKGELIYDKYERVSLVDHLLDKKITLNNFNKQQKFKTLSDSIYKLAIESEKKSAILNYQYNDKNLEFTKKITISEKSEIKARYNFTKSDLLKKYNFATEFNIFFQSPRYVTFQTEKGEAILKRKRIFKKISNLKIADKFKNIYLQFDFSCADVFIIPIYSYANSQDGPEKVFQEASVLFIKKNKESLFKLKLRIDKK
ncbi:MAG: alpha-amylase/4-alpha-glucanotransferase domain-containing protein [Patescibacteria group bacterium]|nr:alpha-amylase/4-alpha-glucanotransferase domain-containing protein [Patescibacteria group bacterium]